MSLTPPPVEYACLYVWHESLSIDEIADRLGIEPNNWYLDGQVLIDGKPPAVGNTWILMSSRPSPISDIADQLRCHSDQLHGLIASGAKARIICHYRPIHNAGIPEIDRADSKLFANLALDLAYFQIPPEVYADDE